MSESKGRKPGKKQPRQPKPLAKALTPGAAYADQQIKERLYREFRLHEIKAAKEKATSAKGGYHTDCVNSLLGMMKTLGYPAPKPRHL